METFTPSDAIALQSTAARNYDGYGGCCNNDGMFGGGSWWILIILFAFMSNGFGGFGGNGAIANDALLNEEFIKRDIFNTNQNVSTTGCQTQRDVLESRFTTQLGLQQLGQQNQACCCETQKEILQNRFDNALQTNTLQAQIAACCCDLTTTIHSEGEATRALITANTIQDLRDRLADKDRDFLAANLALQNNAQTSTLVNTLLPRAVPAYASCSPYEAAFFGRFGLNNGCCNNCGCNI